MNDKMQPVRNDRRTRLIIKIIFGQLLVGLLISAIAIVVLLYAQGNRINFVRMKVIKTGLVSIEFLPKDANVYVNNKRVDVKNSLAKNLSPGSYYIQIEKSDYTTWQTQLHIESESVTVFSNVLLFKKEPLIEALIDERKISLLKNPNEDLIGKNTIAGLFSNNYEIWVDNQVIARYSTPISRVSWYSDNAHILFQQGDSIHIIEASGQNDTSLVKLNSDAPTKFVASSDGTELYFIDNSVYKVAHIR
jgi:hypothetical protein